MHGKDKELSSLGSFDVQHQAALRAFSSGQFSEAEKLCRQAIRLKPDDVGNLNLLGQSVLAQGRPTEAAESFSRAIKFAPNQPNLFFNLTLARQAEGRWTEAIQAITSAISLDPTVPVLHAKYGQLLAIANRPAEAVTVLRNALTLDPKSVSVRLNLAQALADLGIVDEAESLTRAALFLNPKEPSAHRMLGRIHQMKGQFTEAVLCFETSIKLQPNLAAAYFALAYSKQMSEEDHPIVEQMERMINSPTTNEPDRGQLHYALGKCFDDVGEFSAAAQHFEKANQIALASMGKNRQPFDREFETKKVDRLINLFTKDLFSNYREAGSASKRPVFIVGMIRSGTTLVEQILSRHPEISAAGELRFWTENQPKFLLELLSEVDVPSSIRNWILDYDAELDHNSISSSRITDKMPLNYWALGLIHLAYPQAKIIHCRRDPLDTCLSAFVTPYRYAPDFAHDISNIGFAYREYLRLMAHWRSVIDPNLIMEVDYEHLVSNPESNIQDLIRFVDLDWDPICLDPVATTGTINTPSHWQVRQPVYRTSIHRWQHYPGLLEPINDLGSVK